jgi:hypothetical protein
MSFYSNRAPEVIEAARYFGLDAQQLASSLYDDPYTPLPEEPEPEPPTRPASDIAREAIQEAVDYYHSYINVGNVLTPQWLMLAEAALEAFAAEDAERERWTEREPRQLTFAA